MNPSYYPILKALHLVAMTAWMAGMLYLPRIFAYHATVKKGSGENNIFKVMEWRLHKIIMLPAMAVTWICGIAMAIMGGYGTPENPAKWLVYKVVLVLLLSALNGYFGRCIRVFSRDANKKSPRFYKVINEMITAAFVAIVFLVVLKPF